MMSLNKLVFDIESWLLEYPVYALPKRTAHQIIRKNRGFPAVNFDDPKTYDEKLHWLMVNYYDESFADYADKYRVREYIASLGLSDILIPLIKKFDRAEEITLDGLPEKFILKANHGSGSEYYRIIKDKSNADINELRSFFSRALRLNYARKGAQYHYAGIKPCVICEELLEAETGSERMTDYKVVCSGGEPKAILVCSERSKGRDYFDTEWNYLEFVKENRRNKKVPERPLCLDQLLNYSSVISKGFPLARVDFYIIENHIYFGEITLTPSGGCHTYLNNVGQETLGSYITLPEIGKAR